MKKILLAFSLSIVLVACTTKETNKETTTTTTDSVAATAPDTSAVQEKVITDAATPKTPIDSIKGEVARINNANFPSKRHDFMCDEKAYVVYHYDGKAIAKVIIDWGTVGDAYHREEFYYRNGKLIFDYDLLEGAGAYPGGDKKLERRHYVYNDKAVKYLENSVERPCKECSYSKTSTAYRALAVADTKDFEKGLCR